MKTLALSLLLMLTASAAHAQTTRTMVFDLSKGSPVVISDQSRDYGYVYIERGNIGVLEIGPREHEYRIYPGGGFSPYRRHWHRGYHRW